MNGERHFYGACRRSAQDLKVPIHSSPSKGLNRSQKNNPEEYVELQLSSFAPKRASVVRAALRVDARGMIIPA